MNQMSTLLQEYESRFKGNDTGPIPRNNLDDIKEQIWELIVKCHRPTKKYPKPNRTMFFIKTGGVPDFELLSIKKWAESTDNFNRAFYGAVKKYHLKNK